jgi:hypothetical protein
MPLACENQDEIVTAMSQPYNNMRDVHYLVAEQGDSVATLPVIIQSR